MALLTMNKLVDKLKEMAETNQSLTVAQFAERAGVTRQAVLLAVKQGRIKAEKFGSYYVIEVSELPRYLKIKRNY